jgi:hypothetical protein
MEKSSQQPLQWTFKSTQSEYGYVNKSEQNLSLCFEYDIFRLKWVLFLLQQIQVHVSCKYSISEKRDLHFFLPFCEQNYCLSAYMLIRLW